MTEEKATERCEDIIKKNNKVVKEARKAGDTNAMQLVAELDTESLAIETILNIIKERNKRIKELEEEKKNRVDFQKKYIEVTNLYLNSISKQKIKDKIKKEIKYHERNILDIENITMLKSKTAKEEAEIEFNKYAIVVLKKMLQELLEGRK